MDVLIVRNVLQNARKAKDKKAALGVDVTIERLLKTNI